MKKIYFTAVLTMLAIPMLAQLNGNGFYRMKNTTTNRYISIVNDKVDKTSAEIKSLMMSKAQYEIFALATEKTQSNVVSDPGSILYIENQSGSEYNIKGQGLYTYTLTGGRTLKFNKGTNNAYLVYASESGITVFLKDMDEPTSDTKGYSAIGTGQNDGNTRWNIKPIDGTTEYLGVKPEITVDGKYYATLYTSYAYRLSTGMKAYIVSNYTSASTSEPLAAMKEISGDVVPAGTPVIIECASSTAAGNKITPLVESSSKVSGNQLKGNYFCYVRLSVRGGEATTDAAKKLKNVVENKSTIRVLGKDANGKLALVKAPTSYLYLEKYLPANHAYLAASASTPATLTLVDEETYNTLGISHVTIDDEKSNGVYNLQGQRVADDAEGLAKGIYIINGKKVIKD